MLTEVQVANLALSHIGHKTITSMDEASEAARRCKQVYATLRDAVLADHTWNFATSYKELAELDESIPGWSFMYATPSKCLYIRKIFNDSSKSSPIPVEYVKHISPETSVEAISTNLEKAWAEFTYQVTDPNMFSPKFVEALSYRMAAALAQPLTGNIQMGQALLQMSVTLTEKAMLLNKREESIQKPNYSSLIEAR